MTTATSASAPIVGKAVSSSARRLAVIACALVGLAASSAQAGIKVLSSTVTQSFGGTGSMFEQPSGGAVFGTSAGSSRSSPFSPPIITSGAGVIRFGVFGGEAYFPSSYFLGGPYIGSSVTVKSLESGQTRTFSINSYFGMTTSGSLSSMPAGQYDLTWSSQGQTLTSTTGGGYISLDFAFVPEPASLSALCGGVILLMRRTRRA